MREQSKMSICPLCYRKEEDCICPNLPVSKKTMYRKPVSFSQYHFILSKLHGIWCLDCGTWDYNEAKQLEHEANKLYGKSSVKLCSSPSDDERVIQRIIKETNRFAR